MNNGDRLSAKELNELLAVSTQPRVSILLPTAPAGREKLQGPLRLKNALHGVEASLKSQGLRWNAIEDLLGPARLLAADAAFWMNQTPGFALYCSPGFERRFRLPERVEEVVEVGSTFFVTPLLPIAARNARFYVLTISDNHPRLYEADRYGIAPVDVPGMPRNLAEALWADTHERELQRHGAGKLAGQAPGSFSYAHSTGPGTDMERHKSDLKRYYDVLDSKLMPVWNRKPLPVVLAGVGYELPIFRQACSSNLLLVQELHGNYDRSPADAIREAAWLLIRDRLDELERQAVSRFGNLSGMDRTAASLDVVKRSCEAGRVETLFLNRESSLLANGDPSLRRSLNELAVQTLSHGGNVHVVSASLMPTSAPAAATLRF